MTKKTTEEVVVEETVITPITLEYNREDLNLLRDKVNELIARQ